MEINLTPHINYEGKSWPATLVDEIATPLRWAAGEGKINIKNNCVTEAPLSDAPWKRKGYRIIGIAVLVLEAVTIVPLLATLLAKVAIVHWDKNAKTAFDTYQNLKVSEISNKILNDKLSTIPTTETNVNSHVSPSEPNARKNTTSESKFSEKTGHQKKETNLQIQANEDKAFSPEVSDALSRLKSLSH